MMNKVFFVTLGCDKNRVDSEEMLAIIRENGYELVYDENEADAIIINTCCFIDDAKKESIDTILEMAEYKKNNCKALIVTGCLAQRYIDEIQTELKDEVDGVVGTTSFDKIADVLDEVLERHEFKSVVSDKNKNVNLSKRTITTPWHYAYLKIAEGCDKRCTYCIIPEIRGSYRSKSIETLTEEARELVSNYGIKELILVAQESTIYGTDIYGKKSLHLLLRELSKIDGLEWIRVLYAYPEEIYDELILEMKNLKKVLHYLDIPIQHCNDDILRRMGRRIRKEGIINIFKKLKNEIPDIIIRTSLITGFPGETKEQHEELVNFVKCGYIDRLGVFTYSREEGTPAFSFDDQIAQEIKDKRMEELMLTQLDVIREKNEELLGKKLRVMVDGRVEERVYVGRSYMDTPDIDSAVFFKSDREIMSGEILEIELIDYKDYDFIGKEV